jgi:hypothetical protein
VFQWVEYAVHNVKKKVVWTSTVGAQTIMRVDQNSKTGGDAGIETTGGWDRKWPFLCVLDIMNDRRDEKMEIQSAIPMTRTELNTSRDESKDGITPLAALFGCRGSIP